MEKHIYAYKNLRNFLMRLTGGDTYLCSLVCRNANSLSRKGCLLVPNTAALHCFSTQANASTYWYWQNITKHSDHEVVLVLWPILAQTLYIEPSLQPKLSLAMLLLIWLQESEPETNWRWWEGRLWALQCRQGIHHIGRTPSFLFDRNPFHTSDGLCEQASPAKKVNSLEPC